MRFDNHAADGRGNKNRFAFSAFDSFSRGAAIKSFVAILLIFAGILVIFACSGLSGNGKFPDDVPPLLSSTSSALRYADGTSINAVDVSGLTSEAAAARLRPVIETERSAYSCRLYFGEEEFFIRSVDLTLVDDLKDVLERALHAGAGDYEASISPTDDARLRAAVSEIAERVRVAPVKSALLPVEKATEAELASGERNERFVITAPADGVELDIAKTLALIESGETEIELPVVKRPADGSAPALPTLMARFSTSFSGSLGAENRVNNIKKAANILNGTQLEAGKVLSMNELLGERSGEAGWSKATAFASGGRETEQAYGGGICQVSTTLYNCALRSGLKIVERHGHSRKVRYVEGGLDAALSYGSSDLVIKNSTDAAIYVFMWTDEAEQQLFAEIYGEGFGGEYDGIELVSELKETIEPSEPEFTFDESVAPGDCVLVRGAITGSVYSTYRIYLKDGRELRREFVAETTYLMHPALYAVGPNAADNAP